MTISSEILIESTLFEIVVGLMSGKQERKKERSRRRYKTSYIRSDDLVDKVRDEFIDRAE